MSAASSSSLPWCCTLINAVTLTLTFALGPMAMGQDETEPESRPARSLPNLKLPTLGGKQVWTDYRWRGGWRIQKNAITGHWRLLDVNDVRQAWGTRAACEGVLDNRGPTRELDAERIVIILHGLGRSSASIRGLGEAIAEAPSAAVIYFEYASTRAAIGDHAEALRDLVSDLPKRTKIELVGHSMGNIVVRHAIGDWQSSEDHETLDRIEKVVMLGPPNQGSAIARMMSATRLFGWVAGAGGVELGRGFAALEPKLATPHCPFGIIAGTTLGNTIGNPLLDEENDLLVTVEETKLEGAADFLEVPRVHTFLMDDPVVQSAVVHFLDHGKFR